MTILDRFSLAGRVAVVTGAATGLGQAIAVGLAEAGADVVGVSHRSPPDATRAAVEACGRRFTTISVDLGDPDAAAGVIETVLRTVERVDVLVNNAGIIRRAEVLDHARADWDAVLAVNLDAPFLLGQAAARHMAAEGRGGRIINIASMLSWQGGIRVPGYTASKHAVVGLTRAMANELAPLGINVNAIAPGYMVTENTRALREDGARNRAILERIPAGRWGEPEDLQGAVVLLASDAGAYLHGTTIAVDGGWLAR